MKDWIWCDANKYDDYGVDDDDNDDDNDDNDDDEYRLTKRATRQIENVRLHHDDTRWTMLPSFGPFLFCW